MSDLKPYIAKVAADAPRQREDGPRAVEMKI